MKEVMVRKNERTRILYLWSNSMPGVIRFTAKLKSGDPPTGKVETIVRHWFIPKITEYPLEAENQLRKRVFDPSYQIFVTPDEDTTLHLQSWHFQAYHMFLALAAALVLGILAGSLPFIVRLL